MKAMCLAQKSTVFNQQSDMTSTTMHTSALAPYVVSPDVACRCSDWKLFADITLVGEQKSVCMHDNKRIRDTYAISQIMAYLVVLDADDITRPDVKLTCHPLLQAQQQQLVGASEGLHILQDVVSSSQRHNLDMVHQGLQDVLH